MELNIVQKAAFELIQSDARFIYTLTDIENDAQNIESNHIMMSQPYIGIFADGAEQWTKKVGLNAPTLNRKEKEYYTALRQSHKLFEKSYDVYAKVLIEEFDKSDQYFYDRRGIREKLFGYYNVGTDICNGEYCGNTIVCAMHTPIPILGNETVGMTIKELSIVAGKIAASVGCLEYPIFRYNDKIIVKYEDYHFYDKSPLKMKTELGLILFSILCDVNYATVFVNSYFTEEIPQKFKFAYLQYFYLCDFIKNLNRENGTDFHLNDSLRNREFRNCLAHYGLGQFMSECDIIEDDVLKGLTNKAFHLNYSETKELLYKYLNELCTQIKEAVLNAKDYGE